MSLPKKNKKNKVPRFKLNTPQEEEFFKIISNLYANSSMTNSSVDGVVKNIMHMSSKISEYHKNELKKIIPAEFHSQIDKIFQKDFFSNSDTEFKRLKHFKESNCFVPPESFLIGKKFGFKKIDGKKVWAQKSHYGYYVKFEEVLKLYLELPNVYDEMSKYG